MQNQKALFLLSKQGAWQVGETARPTPGPKDVLVKIMSTALNPVDWKVREYGLPFITEYPIVSGLDGAGVVEEVGAEVEGFAKGDRVLFEGWWEPSKVTFQQYAISPAEITAKIPENISFDQAASIPLGFATAFAVLWNSNSDAQAQGHAVGFPAPWEEGGETRFAGKPIFIIGGASSVGQYAIQVAKLSKFSPIITTASPHNASLLQSLGATHVLDRALSPPEVLRALKEITGANGVPLEIVYDVISHGGTQVLGYEALAPGGVLVIVNNEDIPADVKERAKGEGKKVVMSWGTVHTPENRKLGVEVYRRLTGWLTDGTIVPNKVEALPGGLAGILDGLERMRQNKVSALKLIAHPQETA